MDVQQAVRILTFGAASRAPFVIPQLGSGAVKFPPDYQAMFADTPAASNYNLIWAELIGYRRAAGNRGNDFAAMDVWVNTIYVCGKAYAADGYYTNAVAPTATCP